MQKTETAQRDFDVVVVGGGSAGIGVTASLLRRRPGLRIAVIEPSDNHYYQPAWTLVGGGAFDVAKTVRPTQAVMPARATWLRRRGRLRARIRHRAPGRWPRRQLSPADRVPGTAAGLGQGRGPVRHAGQARRQLNYRYDLAPYTWELVRGFQGGQALFTQPAMPIKCAGAPQKAMYLACDHWLRTGVLGRAQVQFDLAGAALFGVPTFVPPLMRYVERYGIALNFNSTLVAVDGPARKAWFDVKNAEGQVSRVEKDFDMLHAVPPQLPHDFVRNSPLADAAGWCEVDPATLRHPRYANVFGLGDTISASNAKTAAAARKQIVAVAENLIACLDGYAMPVKYDGYGSCPLTVERGRIVLAEFGYGGKLLPTFPLDPTVPRKSAWFLKATLLPWIY